MYLHPLSEFINKDYSANNLPPSYWYEGRCPFFDEIVRLPRTQFVEAIARGLMQQLAGNKDYSREGKMYGVLLVKTPLGEQKVLKAFSGMLNGNNIIPGWVPPILGREKIALDEAHTLAMLETIKLKLLNLQQIPARQQYQTLRQHFETRLQELNHQHLQSKHQRQQQRQILLKTLTGNQFELVNEQLNAQSRQDKREKRKLKQQRDETLQPLQKIITEADQQIRQLKQQRKVLSRQLQAIMYSAYSLTNFAGNSFSLEQLMTEGFLPTGTGFCCAPKLLNYAATHQLKALAMAEFWWGPTLGNGDKIQGQFYGACAERCQPLMGFLLSGMSPKPRLTEISSNQQELPIIYQDEWLIAVNKPPGLLSVPGRGSGNIDSVESRLRLSLPDGDKISAIHRLDQETSGILLLARNQQAYTHLSQQFQQRQVKKVYEAVLDGLVKVEKGLIELPLWGNPAHRPYQTVDWQRGKPSVTQFRVISWEGKYTQMEFIPLTGRTHQIRVHAADVQGLGISILGDSLYGAESNHRLHLHAKELCFSHPQSSKTIHLQTEVGFKII